MTYCFDTSVFINAWQRDYPPDVFPTVWNNIEQLITNLRILAPEEVRVELERKDDEVLKWAVERAYMFIPIDGAIQVAVTDILRRYPRLIDTRKSRSGADPFVVALAQIRDLTVVTYEKETRNMERPNIPDVCEALNIEQIPFLKLARRERWQI